MKQYTPPAVTIDGIVFQLVGDRLCVLLVQRQHAPFSGQWALPGGYISADETSQQALQRVLASKASLQLELITYTEQLYTFDTAAYHGGNAISVVYFLLGRQINIPAQDRHRRFVPVDALPALPYDHNAIIQQACERLRGKVMYTNVLFALLPSLFTLSNLQLAYESILGRKLDKRNFRKKVLQLGFIEGTDGQHKEGAHRPARLYRFKQQRLQTLSRSFD